MPTLNEYPSSTNQQAGAPGNLPQGYEWRLDGTTIDLWKTDVTPNVIVATMFGISDKTKLSNLSERFRGVFPNTAAASADTPNPEGGYYFLNTETDTIWSFNATLGWQDTGTTSVGDMRRNVYDPQNKNADAFSRANHTGDQAISTVSGLQSALDGKQASITGAASSVSSSNLAESRAVASDTSGKIVASNATSIELGYLSGVTGAIQSQIDRMGMRKVGEYIVTANAKLSADNIFTSAYENYRVIIGWVMSGASGNYNPFIRFRSGGVANATANYGLAGNYSGPFSGTPSNNGQTSFTGVMNHSGSTDTFCRVLLDVVCPQKPLITTVHAGPARYRFDSNSFYTVVWAGQFDAATVFDGMEINSNSGVFATAKMTVYAYT
jgi:hypothetical protein